MRERETETEREREKGGGGGTVKTIKKKNHSRYFQIIF
jgi:hypothetical protein